MVLRLLLRTGYSESYHGAILLSMMVPLFRCVINGADYCRPVLSKVLLLFLNETVSEKARDRPTLARLSQDDGEGGSILPARVLTILLQQEE